MIYADWIRVFAVHSVIYVHCIMNASDTVGLSERDALEKKEGIYKEMAQLGMPLFFYISGLSTTFFKADRDGFLVYLKGKVMRLLVPMVLACLTLLVPRLYLS